MKVNSDQIEIFRKIEEVKCDEEITDLELDVKIENSDEQGNIKSEVFEEENQFEHIQTIFNHIQTIGQKRKIQEPSNLKNENKKIKEEFVVFEEIDEKEKPQEIKEIHFDDSNNQVINKN